MHFRHCSRIRRRFVRSGVRQIAAQNLRQANTHATGQPVAITTRELSSKNNGRGTNTAARTGGGAALGAIIGGLAGGGTGAGIGAASGGVIGLGSNVLRPGQQIILKPEALLQFQTASTLDVPTASASTGYASSSSVSWHSDHGEGVGPPERIESRYEIVGLKLGMTADEATKAIASRVPDSSQTAVLQGRPQFTATAHYTSNITFSAALFQVQLTFTESYPFNPSLPEKLTNIFYVAKAPTAQDQAQLRQSALAKYGKPDTTSQQGNLYWCDSGTATNGVVHCNADRVSLVLEGASLTLKDDGIATRERDEWSKQGHGAPPL